MRISCYLAILGAVLASVLCTGPLRAQPDRRAAEQLLAAYQKGEEHRKKGELSQAIQQFEIAVGLAPQVYGADNINTANLVNNLALIYQENGQIARAEPLMQHALSLYQKNLPANHPNIARAQNNLGDLHRLRSDYEGAERFYRQSLKSREDTLGKDHVDVAQVLHSLGVLYLLKGDFAQADAVLRRALKIREDQQGKDHLDVAIVLLTLGTLQRQMGQNGIATICFQRAQAIREKQLGADHPDVAVCLQNLAALHASQEQYDQAIAELQRSIRIWEGKFGPGHPLVATGMNSLGEVYRLTGRLNEAEPAFQRSLRIWETSFTNAHPNVAISHYNLGLVELGLGRAPEAEARFRRSLAIRRQTFGTGHHLVAEDQHALALALALQGRHADAAAQIDQSRRSIRRHVSQVLPLLSEADQLRFLEQRHEPVLHQALTFALSRRADAALAAQSAGWVLNGKAVAQQALAESTLLARDSNDPALAADLKELVAVRRQLAALTLGNQGTGDTVLKEVARLSSREQEIARRLRQMGGRYSRQDPWIEVEEVRQRLPADGVLVLLGRFRTLDLKDAGKSNPWQGNRYAAWIIPPAGKGAIQLIDLGEAAAIEASATTVRQAVKDAVQNMRRDTEKQSEAELRRHLGELGRLVLQPLMPHIGSTKHWIISPDADLWLIPWSALPLEGGKYVIEEHEISYSVSGRELADQRDRVQTARPLVLADPDYDLDPQQARLVAQQIAPRAPQLRSVVGRTRSIALPQVPRLPGTAEEARTIVPSLTRFTGQPPEVRLGAQAIEKVVKATHSPRVLVLSTHGYFLEDSRLAGGGSTGRAAGVSARPSDNPLLRCGLLLAGANRRGQVRDADEEDGVLTGLEIVSLDLRGTELVVLSACETALGQVRQGEGVAGLRQAFQLAGSGTVLATLWQIDDRESTQLMGRFFAALAEGQPRAEALREAQLAIIQARRVKGQAAHPFFWAAFTLTGE